MQSPLNGNPLELESFHPYREDIKRELAFKDEIVKKAELFLDDIRQKNLPKRVTFVSIHKRGPGYEYVIKIVNSLWIPSEFQNNYFIPTTVIG